MFGPEEGAISDQASLNKAWASIEHRLRTQSMSERHVLQTLKSGILQTPTGKELAPLFLEAIMRSIKPLAGHTSERLREFVDCICTLPPDRWLDTFGENTYFTRGGLDEYIQSELTIARAHRAQQITAGEFLDNDTWNALRDFTQQARTFIGLESDGQLNETLSQLEDFIDVRPPLKEAKTLVDRFLRAMCKPDANEAAPSGTGFATAQKLSDQIYAIQTGDTPQRSLHEVITATKSQKATHSENGSRYFVFGSPTDSTSTQKSQNKLTFSKLLSLLQEIENKASFFSEVDTEGPRYTGGVGGKLTFVVNAFGTIGGEILSAARHGKPATGRSSMSSDPDTAVGFPLTYADVCMNPSFDTYTGQSKIREQDTGATSTGDLNQLSLKDGYAWKVSLLELEAVVNDFIASIKPPPGSEEKVSNDPGPDQPPAAATLIEMLGHLAQWISDVLATIDGALTFKSVSALPEDQPMLDLQRLGALDAAERGNPLDEGPVYGPTVESSPSPSWRETLAPAINQLVSQLASVLNTFGVYAVGTAASGYQLARSNPGTTAVVGLVGVGGFLTALGTYLTFFKEQLPEQAPADTSPANTLPPSENDAAPTQQQIDDELGSDAGTSVVTPPSLVSTPIAIPTTDRQKTTDGLNTVDTTDTTESGEETTPIQSTTLPPEQVDSLPDDDFPVVETAASHQQRIDDEIERIVGTPVAKGLPPLSEDILQLMYQSPEHNLLNDVQLVHKVALLLEQPSKTDPDKTYVELIQEVQAHSPAQTHPTQSETTTQSTPRPAFAPIRVRREANFAGPPALPAMAAMSAANDVDTPFSDEARLDQYLATMAALKSLEVAPGQVIEDDIDTAADPDLDVAREVVKLLRGRRSAVWSDTSRADGDKQLLSRYTTKVLESLEFPMTATNIDVPTHSTFGQCWLNYYKAFKNPFFAEWADKVGLDLATVKIHLDTNTLSGMTNLQRTAFTLTDNSGWASVCGPILKAAHVISPTHHTVAYPLPAGAVPFPLVAAFHGENEMPDMATAQRRARELDANGAFFPLPADDLLRPAEPRSEAAVESQKQHLGNVYSNHRLVMALNSLIQGKSDDASVKLDDVLMAPSFDSTFALKHPAEAQRMVSAQRYISASGWTVPTNVAQARNLVEVLSTAIPDSPKTGNFWGAFAYPRPLTSSQRNIIASETRSFLGRSAVNGLLEKLLQDKSFTNPAQGLKLALNSEEAKTLGRTLELKLNALPTPGSTAEWAMAALLLDLDSTPGQPRNHVAGYDLTQQANLGAKPSEVVSALEQYLVAQGKVTATTAPAAAYHLLAGSAPEFLVRNMPDNLICGTHTWTMLRIAVSRIEQLSPGASSGMKFEDVMKYGDLAPITVGQEIAVQSLSVNPLVDWAIANGVIVKNASDSYSPEQVTIASEKFQSVRQELAHARDYLTTPTPTRKALALAELTRVFGEGLPYEDKCFRYSATAMNQPTYSLLDIYITGRYELGKYSSTNNRLPVATVDAKFGQLKNVAQMFELEFNKYFDDLQTGSQSIFKHLVSQLPIDDRRSLEYGTQKFYSVRRQANVDQNSLTSEVKDNHKGRHGILIRSQHEDKVSYFEVFPSSLQIRKRTDLPDSLPLGGTPKTVKYPGNAGAPIVIEGSTPQRFDWRAYGRGTPPRENAMSMVIIDEIIPQTLRIKSPGFGYTFGVVPNAFAPGSWLSHIASVAVKEHFITGREQLRELAKGVTTWEAEQQYSNDVMGFFESLIPFKSCVDNIQSGQIVDAALDCTLDAAGFVIPGFGVAGKIAQVAKSGARFIPKVLKITWIAGSYIVINANPLDGVGDLLKAGVNVVGKLGARAYSAASSGIEQLKKLYGTTKAVDPVFVAKRADIAQGTIGAAPIGGRAEKVTAVFKDGKWYDYDVAKNQAYGPPLENFSPDSSITLERTTFSDGSTALTNSRLFDAEPHVIHRSTHTDVVVGEKVYRLDPKNPGVLNDLSSPVYFNDLEGFQTVCSLGGRSKRDTTKCLAKIIKESSDNAVIRLQAIEYKRLYLTDGNPPLVIHERRIYNCADPASPCSPQALTAPMAFKTKTTGSIIDDKHFGLSGRTIDPVLEVKTRVVKIDGIVLHLEDKRDVRAFVVDVPDAKNGKNSYLVAEVDTGLFYYCHYDGKSTNNIEFIKADFTDEGFTGDLLKRYHDIKDPYLKQVKIGAQHNEDFVILPPINEMYAKLTAIGTSSDDIELIKKAVATFTEKEQREFILQIWDKHNVRSIETAIPAIKIETPPLPMGFGSMSKYDKNEYYANEAKRQVDTQLKATGLGPYNQRILSNPQDLRRLALTQPVVMWEYSKRGVPNKFEIILKTGAGNCDQMAQVSAAIVISNGGPATRWHSQGHAFTLVGGPRPGTVPSTTDFSESAFRDAWVVDPWADIVCSARTYNTELANKMASWSVEMKQIIATDWSGPTPISVWMEPTNPQWMDRAVNGPKTPLS
jgi:hypothetical protein